MVSRRLYSSSQRLKVCLKARFERGGRVLPFPSHEVDPYRGLPPHFGVTSARARALHAIATRHARGSSSRLLRRLLPRVTRARASARDVDRSAARPGHRADRSRRAADRRRIHVVRIRRTSTASSPSAAASSTSSRPAPRSRCGWSSSATRSKRLRTYDPATQRSIAPIDQVVIIPLRDVLESRAGEEGAGERSATLFDYLRRAREARIVISERDEVDAHATKLLEQIAASYDELRRRRAARRRRRAGAGRRSSSTGTRRQRWRTRPARRSSSMPRRVAADSGAPAQVRTCAASRPLKCAAASLTG